MILNWIFFTIHPPTGGAYSTEFIGTYRYQFTPNFISKSKNYPDQCFKTFCDSNDKMPRVVGCLQHIILLFKFTLHLWFEFVLYGPFPASSSLFLIFNTVDGKKCCLYKRWGVPMNGFEPRTLVSEATALPTEPQPLPLVWNCSLQMHWLREY